MFCTHVAWVCLVCLLLCKEEGSSPVSLQLLNGGICMRYPCLCLCWVLGGVCELLGETIHNIFGCGFYFVECYGTIECGLRWCVG